MVTNPLRLLICIFPRSQTTLLKTECYLWERRGFKDEVELTLDATVSALDSP